MEFLDDESTNRLRHDIGTNPDVGRNPIWVTALIWITAW
jgi:hypothetical protein